MYDVNPEYTIDIIEQLKAAKIGNYTKWKKLIKKIQNYEKLNEAEISYLTTFTRVYKNSKITARSKILHVKLSKEDQRPKCQSCEEKSDFYCNQNDAYFCKTHIIGHDNNE